MNIFIAIPFTLLAFVAGIYLLAKSRAEGLNRYYRWAAYLVIVVSLLMLGCNLTRGVLGMMHHRGEGRMIKKIERIRVGEGMHDRHGMPCCDEEMMERCHDKGMMHEEEEGDEHEQEERIIDTVRVK